MLPLAIYIHWPFCKFKCPYCDFNSHVREKVNHADWRAAYTRELEFYRDKTGAREIKSIFFGGGTPSLMEPATVGGVINDIDRLWGLPAGTEITLEANPTSVEAEKLLGFKAAGVNRVSLGVQSLRDDALKKLGRQHSASDAMAAVKLASTIFDRYSFDLIYARPDQSLADWQQELDEALVYGTSHMSLYQLTIEEGTQYHTLHQRGDLKIPDENLAADMYELTQEKMEAAAMPAYEVSNHAKQGQESQHNLVYWRYGDYAGIGPGAHGRLTLDGIKYATRAHKAPEIWLERVTAHDHGAHPFEIIDRDQRGREMLLMGLRLQDGVKLADFQKEAETSLLPFVKEARLQQMIGEDLLIMTATHLKTTPLGRQKLNAVLKYILAT